MEKMDGRKSNGRPKGSLNKTTNTDPLTAIGSIRILKSDIDLIGGKSVCRAIAILALNDKIKSLKKE